MFEAIGIVNPAVSEWRVYSAQALFRLGRREEATEMLAPASAAAERSRGPYELGVTLRAAAPLDQRTGIEKLRAAAAMLEASELRLEYARALVELGAALRRSGHRRDARPPLADRMELAHRCGATALMDMDRTELLAAGARPRRIERTGVDALTSSERRVARLAAEGHSNREIAQQLFVTAKTIETHLRSAYLKLGISSRRELTDIIPKQANVQ